MLHLDQDFSKRSAVFISGGNSDGLVACHLSLGVSERDMAA